MSNSHSTATSGEAHLPCEDCAHRRTPTLWDFKLYFSFCKKFAKPCLHAAGADCASPHPGFQRRRSRR